MAKRSGVVLERMNRRQSHFAVGAWTPAGGRAPRGSWGLSPSYHRMGRTAWEGSRSRGKDSLVVRNVWMRSVPILSRRIPPRWLVQLRTEWGTNKARWRRLMDRYW